MYSFAIISLGGTEPKPSNHARAAGVPETAGEVVVTTAGHVGRAPEPGVPPLTAEVIIKIGSKAIGPTKEEENEGSRPGLGSYHPVQCEWAKWPEVALGALRGQPPGGGGWALLKQGNPPGSMAGNPTTLHGLTCSGRRCRRGGFACRATIR